MTFTVTYRDRTGAKRAEVVEAASRAACAATCHARGISPLAIREGASGRKGFNGDKGSNGLKGLKGVLAVLAFLATLGGLWWMWSAADGEPREAKGDKGVKTTKESVDHKGGNVDKGVKAATKSRNGQKRNGHKDKKGNIAIAEEPSAGIGAQPDTPTNALVAAEDASDAVFKTSSDQMFTLLSPADGTGAPPPPVPGADIEQQFRESLSQKIEILDTDSDDVRALKQTVIESRAEMKRLIDSGLSFAEVVREHEKLASENATVRREMMDELNRLIESGDTEGAIAYRKRINEALGQMGIAPLQAVITEEERIERAERRRERRRQRREAEEAEASRHPAK